MQEITENRWQMNKLGIINYWWYDDEVFTFEDGNMLFRGTNGSRKKYKYNMLYTVIIRWKKKSRKIRSIWK